MLFELVDNIFKGELIWRANKKQSREGKIID